MFNVIRFSKKTQKFTFDQKHINESAKKYNKLMIETNEDIKRKEDVHNILYGTTLTKTTNHSVNDLINNSKYYNFVLIVSFVSFGAGALLFYKNK